LTNFPAGSDIIVSLEQLGYRSGGFRFFGDFEVEAAAGFAGIAVGLAPT
jgi:hypothetical protein